MAHSEKAVPSDFPPPVDPQKEFIKRELDAEDERIEVGVAIVGDGPNDPHGKENHHQLRPALGQHLVGGFAGSKPQPLREKDHRGEGNPEADRWDGDDEGHRLHLSRRQQVGLRSGLQRSSDALPGQDQ